MKIATIFFNNNINKYSYNKFKKQKERKKIYENIDNCININRVKSKRVNIDRGSFKIKNITDYLYKLFTIVKKINFKSTAYFTILLLLSATVLSNFSYNSSFINIATNIHFNNDTSFDISTLKNIYPVFNDTSYIVKVDEIEKQNNDKKNYANLNDNKQAIQILDSMCENKDISVFNSSSEVNINIEKAPNRDKVTINDVVIYDYSSWQNIDFKSIYNKVISLTKTSDKILLYNTHTSETYTNSDKYKFDYSGTFRSRDSNFNMLSVAKQLQTNLSEKNISVIHDTTPHDYGTYTSSYVRSRTTIKNNINNNGNFGISIDVHRDASANLEFRPVANINGVQVAQLMFVMGVGTNSSRNKYAEENLALAIKIQSLAEKIYPGLFRPMYIRDSVYNQDMNKFSLLVEFGATGNTLDEVYLSTRCLSNLLNMIYVN